jgi:hypothetical protein
MNFWKRMRRLGNLALLVLVVMAGALEVFTSPEADRESVRPTQSPAPQADARSGTSGL